MPSIVDKLKQNAAAVTAIFTTIGTIGAGAIYVQNNFASAQSVQELAKNQAESNRLQATQQRQLMLHQLEYYDDRINKLQEEKRAAETSRTPTRRSPSEVKEEIDDIKKRRDFTRQSLEKQ